MRRARFRAVLLAILISAAAPGASVGAELPRLVQRDGRWALLVDGAPYLMLGMQVNNSSAWPAMLSKVWPAAEEIHANTVEMPVYWEQFEPRPNVFDTSVMDALLRGAREHHVHLVLLWFGTWKNGSQHYTPEWMKVAPVRYPHAVGADGRPIDSPSPHAQATLDADLHAFSEFMRHLKQADPQHTVILVQVENEAGMWGGVRDYSPAAQKLFEAPVPEALLAAYKKPMAGGARSWKDVFGEDADEYFQAWSVARFIGQVAAAGKAVYALPMYVNAALRDPMHPGRPPSYESGGPTDNVLWIWKAAAPAIDLLAPDIYQNDPARYLRVLDYYARPDNALFVPETGSNPANARLFFDVLGHGGIGFSPFGIDFTSYSNAPLGAARVNKESLAPFAMNYELMAPMEQEIARLNFEGKLQAVSEEKDQTSQTLNFGEWKAAVSYGLHGFGNGGKPPGNAEPAGRALVAQLGKDEFLVTGFFCRVDFATANGQAEKQRQFLRVEEGSYTNGRFAAQRIWNGDQTDYGLNFTSAAQVLRVRLATY